VASAAEPEQPTAASRACLFDSRRSRSLPTGALAFFEQQSAGAGLWIAASSAGPFGASTRTSPQPAIVQAVHQRACWDLPCPGERRGHLQPASLRSFRSFSLPIQLAKSRPGLIMRGTAPDDLGAGTAPVPCDSHEWYKPGDAARRTTVFWGLWPPAATGGTRGPYCSGGRRGGRCDD